MLKSILLQHKVGLCLHGHIHVYIIPDLAIKYHKGVIKVMVLHRGCGVELG